MKANDDTNAIVQFLG